jgi:hypothetical protein
VQETQTATAFFLGPVAAAYLSVCGLWLLGERCFHLAAAEGPEPNTQRPYFDLLLAILAGAGIFALGAVYRAGWLLPTDSSALGRIGWTVDNLIIYSPIAGVLALRRQGPRTIFLSPARLPIKIGLGLLFGVIAVSIYCGLRGELEAVDGFIAAAARPRALDNFLPVFLEGVALAFAFVRLRWVVGPVAAIVVPAVLFAAAHVPGQAAAGRDLSHMAVFFAFNTALPAAILWTVARSRDVVWMGLVH